MELSFDYNTEPSQTIGVIIHNRKRLSVDIDGLKQCLDQTLKELDNIMTIREVAEILYKEKVRNK